MMTTGLDPVLLHTLLTVNRFRSFTEAARRLGLQQSTVSQHIRRLEEVAGCRLFLRDTHNVAPTADGEAMLGFAERIVAVEEQARRHFTRSELRGRLRFGTTDDFARTHLPEVLRDFTQRHPAVELELTVALSGTLYGLLDEGELDLALAKRRLGDARGRPLRRERLAWLARPGIAAGIAARRAADPREAVPLILYPRPSLTRAIAIETLDAAGIPWRAACTGDSLSGLFAAARAGLGLLLQPERLGMPELESTPPGLLPEAGMFEFTLSGGPSPPPAARRRGTGRRHLRERGLASLSNDLRRDLERQASGIRCVGQFMADLRRSVIAAITHAKEIQQKHGQQRSTRRTRRSAL